MKTTYTQGPWIHTPRARDGHVDTITTANGKEFIAVGVPYAETPVLDYPHENEQTANARLVSKAPEMLALIERLYPWVAKMIVDNSHKGAVLPHDLEQAYKQLTDLLEEVHNVC